MRALLSALACILLLAPSGEAAPVPCPGAGGTFTCQVNTARATVSIVASNVDGGQLFVSSWVVDGVEQMELQAFLVWEASEAEFPSFILNLTPTQDAATGEIRVVFLDVDTNTVTASTTFTLNESGTLSSLRENLSLTSAAAVVSGRVYAVTDFNLSGDDQDDQVSSDANGSLIIQVDGNTVATQGVSSGPLPTAFDVGTATEFDPLLNGAIVALDNTTLANGPADLAAALQWNLTISPGVNFVTELEKTVTLPEPAGALLLAGCLGALAALGARSHQGTLGE